MTSVDVSRAIKARLESLTMLDHYAAPPDAPKRPYVVYYPGAWSPTHRRLDGQAGRASAVGRAVCVNNSGDGALFVAQLVLDLMDGWALDRALVACHAGPLICDSDMQAGFRWSVTVEIEHEGYRRPQATPDTPYADLIP